MLLLLFLPIILGCILLGLSIRSVCDPEDIKKMTRVVKFAKVTSAIVWFLVLISSGILFATIFQGG